MSDQFVNTYGILPLIFVETFLGGLVLEGLLFQLVRELLHVEVRGAAHHVLLQGVVDELVLLLGTGGTPPNGQGCTPVLGEGGSERGYTSRDVVYEVGTASRPTLSYSQ
jgi:hypothetical protein